MKRKIPDFAIFIILMIAWLTGCSQTELLKSTPTATPSGYPTFLQTLSPTQPVLIPTTTRESLPNNIATSSPTQTNLTQSITLTGHTCSVSHLQWSPDGALLASSCGFLSTSPQDKTVRLWFPDGKIAYVLTDYTQPVLSLDWSPDGKTLATGSMDGTIRLFSNEGILLKDWQGDAGNVFAVAWSPNGEVLASASIITVTNPTVQLWDSAGRIITTLSTSFSGGKFYNLAWSPNGDYLLGGATDYKLWKADGEQIFWLTACASCTPAWGMDWSPDSRLWAVGNESGEVEIYNNAGILVSRMQDQTGVNSLAWSPDGRILAGAKTLWSADGTILTRYNSSAAHANSIAWAPDGGILASGDDVGLIRLFTAQGQPIGVLRGHTGPIDALAWSPDGRILASGSDDTTIRLWIIK